MAAGEESEINGGYDVPGLEVSSEGGGGLEEGNLNEDVSGPLLKEGAEPEEENINENVSDPVLLEDEEEGSEPEEENINEDVSDLVLLEANGESAGLEKEDLYLDPVDPTMQLRLEIEEDPEYLARFMDATVNSILNSDALWKLAQRIEQSKNVGFLCTAKRFLKSLEEWLLKSSPLPFTVLEFSRIMFGVWKDTRFVNDLRLTIEEVSHDLTMDFVTLIKEDSAANRVDCMKFDRRLKASLSEIEVDNTDPFPTAMTIRLFVSILISHWTNNEVVTYLEEVMGEKHFTKTLDWIAEGKARIVAFKERNVQWDHLSFTVESIWRIDEAVEEGLRNQLIEKYGVENSNIEATVTRVKRQLDVGLGVNYEHCGYDGGKVMVLVHGFEGRFSVLSYGTSKDVLKF